MEYIHNLFFTIKKLLIEVLLLLLSLLSFLKSFLAAFFSILLKPIFFILRKIFFKIFVKIYLGYFSFLRKVGWDRPRGNPFSFVFNHRTVHILAFVLVFAISLQSILLRAGTAKALSENAGQTRFSSLITREFYDEEADDFIEEYSDATMVARSGYLDESQMLSSEQGIDFGLEDEPDLSSMDSDILVKPEVATTQISKKSRKGEIEYVVQSGDSISTIASDFDVSVNTILWENKLTAYSLIHPGDKLVILPDTGISHKIAKGDNLSAISSKYGVETEDILLANNLADDAKLSVGQKLFIPGGRPYSAPAPVRTSVAYNPITVIKDLINPEAKTAPANKMLWPAQGRITQYFTWRHHGLDIANKQGTPIYAADAGVVIDAGWSTSGYGNKIDIDHGGGKVTRYGHFYKLLVKRGDRVERGQLLGLMGTTGRSTGPHLHFEVRINNRTYNPLDYIK